jgi:hypothetical protein
MKYDVKIDGDVKSLSFEVFKFFIFLELVMNYAMVANLIPCSSAFHRLLGKLYHFSPVGLVAKQVVL